MRTKLSQLPLLPPFPLRSSLPLNPSSRALPAIVVAITCLLFSAQELSAQQESDTGESTESTESDPSNKGQSLLEDGESQWGVGARLRSVMIPQGEIELFVEEAAGGVTSLGFGLDVVRRKSDFELTLSLGYDSLSGTEGFYLEKGDNPTVPGQAPDFVQFDGFGWITFDVNFVYLKKLGDKFNLRYGGGLGLGIPIGDILQTDSICSGSDIQNQCTTAGGGQVNDPADIPPVFPVLNLLAGIQYKVNEQVTINLEGGLRTVFFFGLSGAYFF